MEVLELMFKVERKVRRLYRPYLEEAWERRKKVITAWRHLIETKTLIPETNSMQPEAPINKATDNTMNNAYNISNPVVYITAAVKGRLDEFNYAAEDARPHKHRKQAKATGSGEGKERAAKANMCTSLSLPSGHGGGWSNGQSIATVRTAVKMRVRECQGICASGNATVHRDQKQQVVIKRRIIWKWKVLAYQESVVSDKSENQKTKVDSSEKVYPVYEEKASIRLS